MSAPCASMLAIQHAGMLATGSITVTRTLAVLNQKGGVGKTTLATNLAAAAHLAGFHTRLLDLDPQSSSLDWYEHRDDDSQLAGLSVTKVDKALTRHKFAEITSGYDVAVLDGPARLGRLTLSAAVAADGVLVPMQPAYVDLWASDATLDTLAEADEIRAQLNLPPVQRWFVLNQVKPRTRVRDLAATAVSELGNLVETVIHHRTSFVLAMGRGESVLTAEPNGAAANEVRELYGSTLASMLASQHDSMLATTAHGKEHSLTPEARQ